MRATRLRTGGAYFGDQNRHPAGKIGGAPWKGGLIRVSDEDKGKWGDRALIAVPFLWGYAVGQWLDIGHPTIAALIGFGCLMVSVNWMSFSYLWSDGSGVPLGVQAQLRHRAVHKAATPDDGGDDPTDGDGHKQGTIDA